MEGEIPDSCDSTAGVVRKTEVFGVLTEEGGKGDLRPKRLAKKKRNSRVRK